MRLKLFFVFGLIICTSVYAEKQVPHNSRIFSAKRLVNEIYAEGHRIRFRGVDYPASSVENLQQPLENLKVYEIPEVGSFDSLYDQFKYIRDTRFIDAASEFPRRLSWLFPDDACFVRSEVAANKLIANNYTEPKKIYVFGDLVAATENHPDGYVYWWFHVVPIYRVGETPYVFDPALNPQRPMTLIEWNAAVGGEQTDVKYSICSHLTYFTADYCYSPDFSMTDEQAEQAQRNWFPDEWNRLLEMGRSPEEELGDNPPWL